MPRHKNPNQKTVQTNIEGGLTDVGPRINLFSGLKGRGADESLDTAMAVMIPIVAAMIADGRMEEAELLQIEAICATSPIYDRNSSVDNQLLIMRVTRLIEDYGIQHMCKQSAGMLSLALRETAFVYAVKVVFSDGHVGLLERDVIDNLIGWLDIDQDRARTMIEVVSVMQHPIGA